VTVTPRVQVLTASVPTAPAGVSAARRRRPSGEPPPLPKALNRSGKYWLLLAVLTLAVAVTAAKVHAVGGRITSLDDDLLRWVIARRATTLTTIMRVVGAVASPIALQVAWLTNLAVLLFTRRWRHLFVWVAALLVVSVLVDVMSVMFQRPHPLGVEIIGRWSGFSMPSRPIAILCAVLVNTLYGLVPRGRVRQVGKFVGAGGIALVGFSRVYLAQDYPTDAIVGALIGVTVPLVAFRTFVPNSIFPVTYRRGRTAHVDVTGARRDAVLRALQDQLGVVAVDVVPFGLAGSGGSTPLRVTVKGEVESYLFAKLYTATHVRSDRWFKLGRTLLYGGLEDEKPFNSVRRLVQQEDYALRLLYAAGLPVPTPGGIVEITPEREYLVVMEFFDNAREIGDVDVDVDLIDQGLAVVRRLWLAGLAHRDIKPANLLVLDGKLLVIDSAFAEVRPTPWRQAVDLANMMLVLALRSDVRTVYERALRVFSVEEITEAVAASRGITMPSQLRRLMRSQGRDLHGELKRLLPVPVRPTSIQRWSLRRIELWAVVIVIALVLMAVVKPLLLRSPL
jgi:membrane-associated phospholipid phosphatase/tRNA A-37 threonylcarbamoyl transferase component Bud32